ncbi:MAG: hypothetical protein Q8930_18275, partial [Bacillota bacterium]|nr:hypothetical protein [Bacillota bacterium]
MDKKLEDYLIYSIYGIMAAALIFTVFNNINSPWMILLLSAAFFLLFTVGYVAVDRKDKKKNSLVLAVELLLVCLIGLSDKGGSYVVFFYCTILMVVINRGRGIGLIAAFVSYIAHVIELFIMHSGEPSWSITLKSLYDVLGFSVAYTAAIMLRYVIQQNSELTRVSGELRLKTLEQQQTYEKLLQANKDLE